STDIHTIDEGIRFDASLDGIKGVKLIAENGKLTAASASQICDGASGVVVVNEKGLKQLGAKPLARIHHLTMMGGDPVIMLEAPLHATERALKKTGMKIDDIDLFEVNEAFASVPTAWLKTTGADPERLNVNGGAIALGHPLGGSGTKLMTTLLNALKQRGKRYGLQTMCEGGGMANVTIVERLEPRSRERCRPGLEPGPITTGVRGCEGWGDKPFNDFEQRLWSLLSQGRHFVCLESLR